MAPTSDRPDPSRWVALAPGKGTALVGTGVVALLAARPDDAVVEELWAALRGGGSFDEALTALGAHGFGRLPDLVVAGHDESTTRVVVRGAVVVEVRDEDGGTVRQVVGAPVHSWAEHSLPAGAPLRLRLGPEVDDREPPGPFVVERGLLPADALDVPAEPRPTRWEPVEVEPPAVAATVVDEALEEEAVAAIEVPPAGTDPAPGPPPAPVTEAADDAVDDHYDHLWGATEMRSVEDAARRPDEGGPPPTAEDLPTRDIGLGDGDHDGRTIIAEDVRRRLGTASRAPGTGAVGSSAPDGRYLAVHCTAGHANPVHGLRCRACDVPLAGDAPELVEHLELGSFRFSHGAVVPVARPMLIGRSPKLVGEVRGVIPELVSVPSPDADISRTHLEVRVEGWQVLLVDRGSTNGTTVKLPGRDPQRLRPDHPYPLPVGAVVTLADEVDFTFEVGR